jgi:hypothetical protein
MIGLVAGDFLVVLAAEGEDEPDRRACAGTCREPGADSIQPRVGTISPGLGATRDSQQP